MAPNANRSPIAIRTLAVPYGGFPFHKISNPAKNIMAPAKNNKILVILRGCIIFYIW